MSNCFHHASNLSILPFSQEYRKGSGCRTLYFCGKHAFPEDLEGTGAELLEIGIFDATGARVTGFHGIGRAGLNSVRWNGRDDRGRTASPGIYYYRLLSDGRSAARKIVLLN